MDFRCELFGERTFCTLTVSRACKSPSRSHDLSIATIHFAFNQFRTLCRIGDQATHLQSITFTHSLMQRRGRLLSLPATHHGFPTRQSPPSCLESNTFKSVSKQRTLSTFGITTYKKTGGRWVP